MLPDGCLARDHHMRGRHSGRCRQPGTPPADRPIYTLSHFSPYPENVGPRSLFEQRHKVMPLLAGNQSKTSGRKMEKSRAPTAYKGKNTSTAEKSSSGGTALNRKGSIYKSQTARLLSSVGLTGRILSQEFLSLSSLPPSPLSLSHSKETEKKKAYKHYRHWSRQVSGVHR